jgi:hypothetical protein
MKLVNSILIFVGGVAVGAIPTYIITKRIERKRADEEIAAYKDYVDKKIAYLEAKLEKAYIDDTEEETKVSEGLVNPEKSSIEELSKRVDAAVENYERVKKNIEWQGHMSVDEAMETGDPDLIEQAEWLEKRDKMLAEGHIKGQDGSPQVISQLSYTGEGEGEYTYEPNYDHISLDWYAGDGILAYGHPCSVDGEEFDMGEMVEKPGFVVGWEWKKHFGDPDLCNDADCVYVRNELLRCDFEIVRDPASYKKAVLGIDDSDEENSEVNDGEE